MDGSVALEQGRQQLVSDFSAFAKTIFEQKYAWKDESGKVTETWGDTSLRVTRNVMGALGYTEDDPEFQRVLLYITQRKFMPGGRYLYASGRGLHQVNNCLLLRAEDSREGWAELMQKAGMALMTGAGIGIDYSDIRENGAVIHRTGGQASGPLSLMKIINEIGRNVMQGGSRRSAIWAGLNWNHPDILEFIHMKNWSREVRELKETDFNFPATMDMTNISVLLDDEFFSAFENESHSRHEHALQVYWETTKQMLKTAEPGFSIDVGINAGETLRNACTELSSRDDSDICNLGSINLAKVESIHELRDVVEVGTLFLLAGTVYSHVPFDLVADVRRKNRRLGLGVMGVHEWLLARNKPYAPDSELGEWLRVYAQSTEIAAGYADKHGLSRPVKTRAIAPTGTIGIIAETTTGIEPIYCVAFKRRYLQGNDWKFQYVVDPTAKRLVESGVDHSRIEDAYQLALDVERRVEMQAWIQEFVDHGISSTINLPYPITDEEEVREFGHMLLPYLPHLRGVTVYPDGARGGQPLSPVPYHVAVDKAGVVFEEIEERCSGQTCGT